MSFSKACLSSVKIAASAIVLAVPALALAGSGVGADYGEAISWQGGAGGEQSIFVFLGLGLGILAAMYLAAIVARDVWLEWLDRRREKASRCFTRDLPP